MDQVLPLALYFTVALQHAGDDLLVLEIARLKAAVRQTQAELPFAIKGWVVLPDHLHVLWRQPEGDVDPLRRWRRIMRRFDTSLPKGPRRLAHIAGGGQAIWASEVRSERITTRAEARARLVQMAQDPLRHGLVERVGDWPFASAPPDGALGWPEVMAGGFKPMRRGAAEFTAGA